MQLNQTNASFMNEKTLQKITTLKEIASGCYLERHQHLNRALIAEIALRVVNELMIRIDPENPIFPDGNSVEWNS